jgi:hypothetical protein
VNFTLFLKKRCFILLIIYIYKSYIYDIIFIFESSIYMFFKYREKGDSIE